MKEGRCAYKILTGKPTGNRHLGKPRRRWEDNMRMNFKEIGINTSNWLGSLRIGIIGSPCECGFEPLGSLSH